MAVMQSRLRAIRAMVLNGNRSVALELIDKALEAETQSVLPGLAERSKVIEQENFRLRRDLSAAVLLLKGWVAAESPVGTMIERSQELIDSFKP